MAEIIVVSGSWPSRALLKAQLEEAGHDVLGLSSVEDTLPLLRTGPLPKLVIIDTQGLDVSSESLRFWESFAPPTNLLVVTGPFEAARLSFASLGIANVLMRPVLLSEIVRRAEELLAGS